MRTRLAYGFFVVVVIGILSGCDWISSLFGGNPNGSFTLNESGYQEVTVTLTPSTGSTFSSYVIERGSTVSGPWTKLTENLIANTYKDAAGLTAPGTYYYQVYGIVAGNGTQVRFTSEKSSIDIHTFSAPAGLSVEKITPYRSTETVKISWMAAAHATSYNLYFSKKFLNEASFFSNSDNFILIASNITTTNYSIRLDSPPEGMTLTHGDSYYLFIEARNDTRISPKSTDEIKFTIAGPAGAVNPLSLDVSGSAIRLSWSDDPNAEGYVIFRSTDRSSWDSTHAIKTLIKPDGYDSISKNYIFIDTSVSTNQTYFYIVHGYSVQNGPKDIAAIVTSATFSQAIPVGLNTAIAAPTNVVAVFDGSRVNLSWSGVANATGYSVYRSTDSNDYRRIGIAGGLAVIAQITNGSTTMHTDNSNLKSVGYYYWVVASGPNNTTSAPSNGTFIKVDLKPPAPTSVVATPRSDTVISISWNASMTTDTVTYTVQRKDVGGAWVDDANLRKITGTSGIITGLSGNTTYYFQVTAYNSAGSSSSPSAPQTYATTLPVQPTISTGTITDIQIQLSWSLSAGATMGYRLYRSDAPDASLPVYTKIADLGNNQTTYTATGLNAGQKYGFKITALNSDGIEPSLDYLNPQKMSTIALQTPFLNTPVSSGFTITITWGLVATATSYKLQYRIGTGSFIDVPAANIASSTSHGTSTFTPEGAVMGNMIYLRVMAMKGTDSSAWSSEKSIQLQ